MAKPYFYEEILIQLYEYNKTAYETASAIFQNIEKTVVIRPAGMGKSSIAFRLCVDNQRDMEDELMRNKPSKNTFGEVFFRGILTPTAR